jgi:DNA end-binding protein Ku
VAGEEITVQPEAEPTKVVDLMEALKASVEAAKKERPAAATSSKSTAKKSTAKKSAAKKSTAGRKRAAS